MIYLDTGCLVKLYYPEQDSAEIVALVRNIPIYYTPLHELEFVNALQLKMFFGSATASQISRAREFIAQDLLAGVLRAIDPDWTKVTQMAVSIAQKHTPLLGCRSLDVLHCAAAQFIGAQRFLTTDSRQLKLALAIGLNLAQA